MATDTKYKTYSEKLKDPRWQKKRLEVLERDKSQADERSGTPYGVELTPLVWATDAIAQAISTSEALFCPESREDWDEAKERFDGAINEAADALFRSKFAIETMDVPDYQ